MYKKNKHAKKLMRISKSEAFSFNMEKMMKKAEERKSKIVNFYKAYPLSYELLRGIPEEKILDIIWEYVLYYTNFDKVEYVKKMINSNDTIFIKVYLVYEFLRFIHEYGFKVLGEVSLVNYIDEIIDSLEYFNMNEEKNLLEDTIKLFNFDKKKKRESFLEYENTFSDENLLDIDKKQYKDNVTKINRSYHKNLEKLKGFVKSEINYVEPSKFSKFLKKLSKL